MAARKASGRKSTGRKTTHRSSARETSARGRATSRKTGRKKSTARRSTGRKKTTGRKKSTGGAARIVDQTSKVRRTGTNEWTVERTHVVRGGNAREAAESLSESLDAALPGDPDWDY